MSVIVGIWQWIVANYAVILSVIGGLIALDEVLLNAFPNSQESSIFLRIKEVLSQIMGVLSKLIPSNNPPPQK